MKKYSLRRRAFSVVLGVLFVFLQFLDVSPVFSFTTLNECFTTSAAAKQCAADGLITPQSAANVVRGSVGTAGAANPISVGLTAADKILILGSAAALGYMTYENMENLRKQAIANAPIKYPAGTYLFAPNGSGSGAVMGICVTPCSLSHSGLVDGYDFGYKDGFFLGKGYPNQLMVIRDADGNPPSPLNPSLSDAAKNLSDAAILAEAAVAAAAAARDAANRKDDSAASAAAAAAAAASGLVAADPSATQADKDKAAAAAAAAAQAAADAKDPTKAPDKPKDPALTFTKTNFLAYAVSAQGFGNKFPFGMFAPLPTGSTQMSCPIVKSWGTTVELCFIRDIIRVIKWIIWTNFAITCFLNL